jgi:hypothetical protein
MNINVLAKFASKNGEKGLIFLQYMPLNSSISVTLMLDRWFAKQ